MVFIAARNAATSNLIENVEYFRNKLAIVSKKHWHKSKNPVSKKHWHKSKNPGGHSAAGTVTLFAEVSHF